MKSRFEEGGEDRLLESEEESWRKLEEVRRDFRGQAEI